jgi:hypothetical protein
LQQDFCVHCKKNQSAVSAKSGIILLRWLATSDAVWLQQEVRVD